MSEPGIDARGVWKRFQRGERHDSLRDVLAALAGRALRRAGPSGGLRPRDFWALRDISFQVHPGDALGIIGANGAGKSTLLKLITGILEPTHGRCAVHGRVGGLIEIAAGFHPDLTGRENVFLQGAVMGMTRAEIVRRFDEIVAFSGIAEFIDTPVKRYSSGMNARLGFAIAAHLEPDVLVIDEVLAVGDFAFQELAFQRIHDLVRGGTPVVVVSHQMERVATLCTEVMLLDRGTVVAAGPPRDCIAAYLTGAGATPDAASASAIHLESIALTPQGRVRSGERLDLVVHGSMVAPDPGGLDVVEIRVRSLATGLLIFASSTDRCGIELPREGPFGLEASLQANVPAGTYAIEAVVYDRRNQRVAAQGPFRTLDVEDGDGFSGPVQLNARMWRVDGGA